MIDVNLTLRSSTDGALSASEQTRLGVDFGGPDLVKQTYEAIVPSAAGTTPTLDIKIQESDDGTTWRDHLTFKQITAAGKYYASGVSDARYRRAYITLGGTSPNFGVTLIHPVAAGQGNEY